MKSGLATFMVTLATLHALPASALAASAQDATVQPVAVAPSADELPLTPRFASLLTSYRNCVLEQVDQAQLGNQQAMARDAMSACALSRGELRSQLISDIQAQQPHLSPTVALSSAESGLEQVDPMIEAAAIDWAHVRYARTMY